MSIVLEEAIEVISQSIGITNLSPDVLPALAADVEYRIREIMQEAIKCMRHSKRTTLSTDDVDSALTLRNVEPIYGFASGDPLRFRRAAGYKDLFYIEEKDVEFKDVIEAPLPKAPLDTALFAHWLAIEGVQPAIPENPPLEALAQLPADNRKAEYKEDGVPVDLKIPVKHVLSRELQLYYDKITELTVNKSNSPLFKEALASLATDPGLHPLVPYFTYFVADEVARNLNNFDLLFALMRLVWSLLQNSHLHIEPYLHQSMPSVMTCLVARRLGNKISDNHWELRDFTAKLVALICRRYGPVYHSLQPRVTKTLLHAYLDPAKALPQHYGAIQGLAALGPGVVRLLVLPNLEAYLRLLEPEMQLEIQKNEMKRHEAWRVYGALMRAAGLCMYEHFKMLPASLSPANRTFLKSKLKVLTTLSNKRKASTDDMISEPSTKKLMTDGPAPLLSDSSPVGLQGATDGQATTVGVTDADLSSGPQGLQNETVINERRTSRREINGGQSQKAPVALGQAWKKDIDAANLLPPLFDYFGESMLFFAPSPELSFFL
ncbi:transcription initiation factor TFIID subunit 6-like isoform X2 [Lycium barbarum]|uniref:transcription initiation factor TFIID subunit 6-like isoform X2 n=1 Tax=Lycium barbarum TaxID=112863 RepID=UPI00293F1592|nr:transcription initiation factor TFIID subunit 6-like isoform X2 [Lycium barbarum]